MVLHHLLIKINPILDKDRIRDHPKDKVVHKDIPLNIQEVPEDTQAHRVVIPTIHPTVLDPMVVKEEVLVDHLHPVEMCHILIQVDHPDKDKVLLCNLSGDRDQDNSNNNNNSHHLNRGNHHHKDHHSKVEDHHLDILLGNHHPMEVILMEILLPEGHHNSSSSKDHRKSGGRVRTKEKMLFRIH